MRIEQLDLSEWREALPDSGIEVFHRPEALATLDDHATGDLELYGDSKETSRSACCRCSNRRSSWGPRSRRRHRR